jgi:hypothetical protein
MRGELASAITARRWLRPRGGNEILLGFALALLGVLAGCASPPLQETKIFQQSFTAVDGAGEPLLDDLAIAERLQRQRIAVKSAKDVAAGKPPPSGRENCKFDWRTVDPTSGFIAGLCAQDAPYYSKIGDPPQTAIFRKSLGSLKELTDALLSLADGTSAAAASAQVQQLAQNAGGFAAELTGVAGGPAAAIGPAVNGVATALAPLINLAANAASVEQERRVILDAQTQVASLIKALHDAAPSMFNPLIDQLVVQIELEDHPQPADAARIEAYRVLVSDYMRLLDRLGDAWNQLVVAARKPSNPVSLSAAAAASGQIAADAVTIRRSLAALRLGAATQ